MQIFKKKDMFLNVPEISFVRSSSGPIIFCPENSNFLTFYLNLVAFDPGCSTSNLTNLSLFNR